MAWWDKLGKGIKLVRPAQIWAMAANVNMFIAHGKVLVTSIIGEVVVNAIDGGCGNCSLTTETVDIATAIAIDSDAVGQKYSVATIGGALIVAAPFIDLQEPFILPDGEDISITITAGSTDSGEIKWTVTYRPMDPGAYLALA